LASITLLAIGAAPARADGAKRPNVLVILADDKYESAGHKAQNLRKNRQNAGLFASFQIARNHFKFRGITGN
jgi:hypothetical protein